MSSSDNEMMEVSNEPTNNSSEMSTSLDMSLDQIMANNKAEAQAERKSSSTTGATRKHSFGKNRGTPYSRPAANVRSTGGASGTRLFVGNLDWSVQWQDLKDLMATVGDVTRADVMSLPNGRSKGCGIVEFSNPADAANAMAQLQEHDLKGRNIFLREDREEKGFATRPFAGRPFGVQGQAAGMPKSFESNSFVASAIRKEFDADCQVYVGNLPWNVSWQELKDIAANYGTVIRADIPQDGKRRSKGFGTLVFDHRLGAKRCIDGLNGCELKGRTLFVEADKHAAKDNSTVSARSNPQQVQQRAAPAPRVFNGNSSNNVNSNVNRHGDTKIIVFNLPFSTSWQDLKDICRAYGDVTHAAVPDVNGKSKGFGTVAFSNPRDANKAIRELNNIAIGDRNITARLYIQ